MDFHITLHALNLPLELQATEKNCCFRCVQFSRHNKSIAHYRPKQIFWLNLGPNRTAKRQPKDMTVVLWCISCDCTSTTDKWKNICCANFSESNAAKRVPNVQAHKKILLCLDNQSMWKVTASQIKATVHFLKFWPILSFSSFHWC